MYVVKDEMMPRDVPIGRSVRKGKMQHLQAYRSRVVEAQSYHSPDKYQGPIAQKKRSEKRAAHSVQEACHLREVGAVFRGESFCTPMQVMETEWGRVTCSRGWASSQRALRNSKSSRLRLCAVAILGCGDRCGFYDDK